MALVQNLSTYWARWGLLGRLLLPVGLSILFGFGAQVYLSLQSSIAEQYQRHQQWGTELGEVLSPLIAEQAIIGDYATIKQLLTSQVEKRNDLQNISWLDGVGGSVSVSGPDQRILAPGWFIRMVDVSTLHLTHDISLAGTPYGKLELAITTIPALNVLWADFLQHTLNLLLIVAVVFVMIALILRNNLKTLRHLSSAADQLRDGNYAVRIPPAGARELRTAVEAFNNMANRSEQLLADLIASKQELREQLYFNVELFDAVPIPIFYKDKDGIYLGVNRAWEAFFGRTRQEILGRTLFDIYTQDASIARQHFTADQELLGSPSKQRYEILLPGLPDGDRHTLFTKASYSGTDGNVRGIIGAITDLTEAKCAEQKAQAALLDKHAAEAASETKSSFLANMSHEIRTPLTAIIGFSETLLDRDTPMQDRVHAIETIIRSGKHLLQIINDILDLSKIEAGKLDITNSGFSIIETLSDTQALVSLLADGKGIEFKVDYRWPLPEQINSDPLRLKQILINLCNNAIKFTEKGSVHLTVNYYAAINKLQFEIIDTGIGMTQEQIKNLFNPFSQADVSTTRKYGGTGLGLYLSRKLAKCLGGDINVTSTAGKGSCFTLIIDAGDIEGKALLNAVPKAAEVLRLNPAHTEMSTVQGRILLAEDNPDNQQLISLYLRKRGALVTVAENGEIAIPLAMQGDFDLVLMDMQMPVMDGVTATRRLRAEGYAGPIVALTANAMQEDVDKCLAAGCNDFLGKPIDSTRFHEIISHYLDTAGEQFTANSLTSLLLEQEPGFADLVMNFIHRLPQIISEIEEAYTQTDWPQLKQLLHKLKGIAGSYGYPQISETAAHMEFELAKKNKNGLPVMLNELNSVADRIYAGAKLLDVNADLSANHQVMCSDVEMENESGESAAGYREDEEQQPGGDLRIADLPGMDIKNALDCLGGNQADFIRIARGYRDRNSNVADNIARLINNGDLNAAGHAAHSLKGSSGNLGATHVYELAADVEQLCRKQQPEQALAELENLRASLKQVLDGLARLGDADDNADIKADVVIESNELQGMHRQLVGYLDTDLGEAQSCFREIKKKTAGSKYSQSLNEFENALNNFDIDTAKAIMERIDF